MALALVNADLLAWARRRRRLSAEVAAKRAGVDVDRLLGWESGEARPTIPMARKLARAYGYPLAIFYLSKPPLDFDPMQVPDFRRLGTGEFSEQLAVQIRDAWRFRLAAVEIAEDLAESVAPLAVAGAADLSSQQLAEKVRELLAISIDRQRKWRETRVAYNAWRSILEDAGYLVLQFPGVDLSEARAFALGAEVLPTICVNSKDAYAGRTFSLFHELGHLLLDTGGVCDEDEDRHEEAFCNEFAGNFLVPASALLAHDLVASNGSSAWDAGDLRKLAKDFAVSEEVVLRRLLSLKRTTPEFYRAKRAEYLARAEEQKLRSKGDPKIPIQRRVISRLGHGYVRRVLIALDDQKLTTSAASRILGAKVKFLPRIAEATFG